MPTEDQYDSELDTLIQVRESSTIKKQYKDLIRQYKVPISLSDLYRIGAYKLLSAILSGQKENLWQEFLRWKAQQWRKESHIVKVKESKCP